MVGLSQFLIWVISTFLLVSIASSLLFPELGMSPTEKIVSQDIMSAEPVENQMEAPSDEMIELQGAFSALRNIDFGVMLGSFLFYFLAGYLLYAAMFASIGAAVDSETVTLPLILALFVLINAINNPDSSIAFWFSLIPFTSPVVMMARIPFGVPYWQVILSMALLVGTFLGMTWVAAKIYRTGILMYGKKISYREIWKWIRYG
jgi:ABC-2 type transport system permease protein